MEHLLTLMGVPLTELFELESKNVKIEADRIEIGDGCHFGENINVKIRGTFSLGSYSRLGNNVSIKGNNVSIGEHFFHTQGLVAGGGGSHNSTANLVIGNRCTFHNNFLNLCKPVTIGNDVGFSHDVSVITHGYWQSVLEGYPAKFSAVDIGNGVIIGYRTLIMMGIQIADNCVVGGQSVVSKNLLEKGVYAGSPARKISDIVPLSEDEKVEKVNDIIDEYKVEFEERTGSKAPEIKIDFLSSK